MSKNDRERGESKARKVSDAAREGGAGKRGALVRQSAEMCAKAREHAEASRGCRYGRRPCPFVKQRASNGCKSNGQFWARMANRTHLGRIPCEKRSEDDVLLSWTHDQDASSGSEAIREGPGVQDPPRVSSTKTRHAFLRIRVSWIKTKKRQSGARFGRFDDCEPKNSPQIGGRCVLAKSSIASIRKRGTRMASERFLGSMRYPS